MFTLSYEFLYYSKLPRENVYLNPFKKMLNLVDFGSINFVSFHEMLMWCVPDTCTTLYGQAHAMVQDHLRHIPRIYMYMHGYRSNIHIM